MRDPSTLPREPGVYLFKDREGTIIYIGKAKSLRSRVSSYFGAGPHSPKTAILVRHIAEIEHIIVDNEVEALLLENRLIKKHAPKYNVSLKDGKTYAYIALTADSFPRLLSTRAPSRKGKAFGPYVDGGARNQVMALTQRLFQLRTCKTMPKRPCLNYHLGLCTAPCAGYASEEQYAAQVRGAEEFLKGHTKDVLVRLGGEMAQAAKERRYEAALEAKRRIDAIEILHERQKVDLVKRHDQDIIALKRTGLRARFALFSIDKGVLSGKREFRFDDEEGIFQTFVKQYYATRPIPSEIVVSEPLWEDGAEHEALEGYLARLKGAKVALTLPQQGEKAALARLALKNLEESEDALVAVQDALNLPSVPAAIECFDISNLGREHIVAGMTRWTYGMPDGQGYRRFLIRDVTGRNDDFASMHEAVRRRYARVLEEGSEMPGLVIVDGGAGQLAAALRALGELGLKLPIVGLAKREEELYLPGEEAPRRFDKMSRMMLLLRRIRDSTHRQAIRYNRKRREMGFREQTAEKK